MAIRTFGHRVSFAGMVEAYRKSYVVARRDPSRYTSMSMAASRGLCQFCSEEIVRRRLAEVFAQPTPTRPEATDVAFV